MFNNLLLRELHPVSSPFYPVKDHLSHSNLFFPASVHDKGESGRSQSREEPCVSVVNRVSLVLWGNSTSETEQGRGEVGKGREKEQRKSRKTLPDFAWAHVQEAAVSPQSAEDTGSAESELE